MAFKLSILRGDKVIWAIVLLLALISFLPVYSASANLVYVIGKGTTFGYLFKHFCHLLMGFGIIFLVHKLPYHYFKALSLIGIPFAILLLIYTLFQGTVIGGANASRWIEIPFVGVGFQPSTLAFTIIMVYVARYLAKNSENTFTFKESFIELWIPVFSLLILILPSNFSTTALIFSMICMLLFIGNYPLKYLGIILAMGLAAFLLFLLLAKAYPDTKLFSRVKTWESRIESFFDPRPQEDDYQIEKAKIAIASGGIKGLGPGKSVQKNFLPQSSSDFIFAIIVEEYGLIGAFGIIFLYLLLLVRFLINAQKAGTIFGKLLIIGLGFPIIFQAFINMGVAVELLPVTGQTLPLISAGGTSIWMTCLALGIILSVTKKDLEVALDEEELSKRNEILNQIINREIDASILENKTVAATTIEQEDDDSLYKGENPLQSLMNK